MKINVFKMKLAMADACITISELSLQSKVSRVALSRLMSGETDPKPATIGKIAKALNVKAEDLIEDQERLV